MENGFRYSLHIKLGFSLKGNKMKTYTIYGKGNLTMKHCHIADKAVKSGMIEAVDADLVVFHSLKVDDIKPAREVMKRFGFDVKSEIFEERIRGCICHEVDVTNEIRIS